jgi:PKD repeat protein
VKVLITLLTSAALTFAVVPSAQATNVVPNPGFEQGGCGASTPVICGWQGGYQIGSAGNYSMSLGCSPLGCHGSEYGDSLWAQTDPAFCAAIGPGPHPASFFGQMSSADSIDFSASFYRGLDCTGGLGGDSLGADAGTAGQVSGVLVAPPGTQSALFSVSVFTGSDCSDYCTFSAIFDDLDVEDAVLPIPAITSFAPAGGLVGASVDIQGWNLNGATSVAFNGINAVFTVDSNSDIHAIVPSGATSGAISVTTPSGTAASKSPFTVTASLAPAISSFAPMGGQLGSSVDILGWNLAGATSVAFNGAVAQFKVDSDSEIHATAPSSATSGPISVTTPNGTVSSCCFSVPPPPSISSFTPTGGPAGTSVNIQGDNFTAATSVAFNGTAATFILDSSTNVTATVPNGATNGPISVTTPEGTARSSASYTVDAPPIARFAYSCSALTCTFDGSGSSDPDGTVQSYRWDFGDGTNGSGKSPTRVYARAGAYTVTLTVTDDGGTSASTSQTFTLIALTARGYKVKGLEKVDLSWSGPTGASFDVYRNGRNVAAILTSGFTDNLNTKGAGSYSYKVCVGTSLCSNTATVSF